MASQCLRLALLGLSRPTSTSLCRFSQARPMRRSASWCAFTYPVASPVKIALAPAGVTTGCFPAPAATLDGAWGFLPSVNASIQRTLLRTAATASTAGLVLLALSLVSPPRITPSPFKSELSPPRAQEQRKASFLITPSCLAIFFHFLFLEFRVNSFASSSLHLSNASHPSFRLLSYKPFAIVSKTYCSLPARSYSLVPALICVLAGIYPQACLFLDISLVPTTILSPKRPLLKSLPPSFES